MTAADVLRARADRADEYARKSSRYAGEEEAVAEYRKEAAELRALADLVEAIWWRHPDGQRQCSICGGWNDVHRDYCAAAAVERVIGEQGNE